MPRKAPSTEKDAFLEPEFAAGRARNSALAQAIAGTLPARSRAAAARRRNFMPSEPVAHIGQPDESAAADLQRGQFTPGQYSMNRFCG